MERRKFLTNAAKAGIATVAIPAFADVNQEMGALTVEIKPGDIMHSVYFWLKKGITPKEEDDFLGYFSLLKKVPGARILYFGKAAKTATRDVTDNTFDYNLIVLFDSLDDVAKYGVHPDHVAGATKYQKYWDRVQVRDTEII